MFIRESALRAAMLKAAAKTKVGHHAAELGKGNWVARRAILNTERPNFGLVRERDQSPRKERK